jgi:hypothetical protein
LPAFFVSKNYAALDSISIPLPSVLGEKVAVVRFGINLAIVVFHLIM